jgi:hypothetical protein
MHLECMTMHESSQTIEPSSANSPGAHVRQLRPHPASVEPYAEQQEAAGWTAMFERMANQLSG